MMSSRDKILAAVSANQPSILPLPDLDVFVTSTEDIIEQFRTVVTTIGSRVIDFLSLDEIGPHVKELHGPGTRIFSMLPELQAIAEIGLLSGTDPHTLENIELAILKPHFAVAENGSCWITEDLMGHRVVPFICQHLAMVVYRDQIVPKMHQAYDLIADVDYGYAAFIAGPSKTADIEQSLVLGAHGPRSMTIFLVG